ncbi:MAG: TolC family protein [Bdellovibrionaceae bacterium]|nr:TolC family protein [Pseudobdellovibrionaceae bacterium]
MKHIYSFLILLALTTSTTLGAQEFSEVWVQIEAHSPAHKATALEYESAQISYEMSKQHWLPQVYLNANAYHTNDPGASFFGVIQQRDLQASDFNPSLINEPDASLYAQGALGVNINLYEGGMSTSKQKMMEHLKNAKEHHRNQTRASLYLAVAKSYIEVGVLNYKVKELKNLRDQVDGLLKRYQFGSRENPVGYSGLLGLKSLRLRLVGQISQYSTHSRALQETLQTMGSQVDISSLMIADPRVFVKRNIFTKSNQNSSQESFELEVKLEQSKASTMMAEMEKARYRPRIGAFAETYLFNGKRDTATGYTAGVYLQWSLFNPSDRGVYKKSRLQAEAYGQYAQALRVQQEAQKNAFQKQLTAIDENLDLLNQSAKAMDEQLKTMERLFKNGSINALQLAEVFNRRADVIAQTFEAAQSYVESAEKSSQQTKFDPNQILKVK